MRPRWAIEFRFPMGDGRADHVETRLLDAFPLPRVGERVELAEEEARLEVWSGPVVAIRYIDRSQRVIVTVGP